MSEEYGNIAVLIFLIQQYIKFQYMYVLDNGQYYIFKLPLVVVHGNNQNNNNLIY